MLIRAAWIKTNLNGKTKTINNRRLNLPTAFYEEQDISWHNDLWGKTPRPNERFALPWQPRTQAVCLNWIQT